MQIADLIVRHTVEVGVDVLRLADPDEDVSVLARDPDVAQQALREEPLASLSSRSMLSDVIANESDSKRSVGVERKPSSSRCVRSAQRSVPPAASRPAASSARMLPRTTRRIRPAVQLVPVCGGGVGGGVGLSAATRRHPRPTWDFAERVERGFQAGRA